MRVSQINNYNINFGYNKKLNNELKSKLSKFEDKEYAQTLLSLNEFCNSTEDKIRRLEKKSDFKKSSSDFVDMLLQAKEQLAMYVDILFGEEFKYSDREYKHYQDEFYRHGADKENDWRYDMMDRLKYWSKDVIDKNNAGFSEASKSELAQKAGQILSASVQMPKSGLLELYTPSANSPRNFDSVAGMDKVKREFNEGLLQLIKSPDKAVLDYSEYGILPPKTVLLYGPPGCGKTFIAKALSGEAELPLFLLKLSKAGSHYINMTSKNIEAAFDEAIDFSKNSGKPCILFIDEIDSIGFKRDEKISHEDLKQVTTLLQALDKAGDSNVFVIGATNKFKFLDPAVIRRYESKIYVDVPDLEARKALIELNLLAFAKGEKLLADKDAISEIAKLLNGFSNDSICKISNAAARNALRRDRADISIDDYKKAIEETSEIKPDLKEYNVDDLYDKKSIGFK